MSNRLRKDEIKELWEVVKDPATTPRDRAGAYSDLCYDHYTKFCADLRKLSNRLLVDVLQRDAGSDKPQTSAYFEHYTGDQLLFLLDDIKNAQGALARFGEMIEAEMQRRKAGKIVNFERRTRAGT